MIEKIVQRTDDGAIERILERTLTPLEECLERTWPSVRRGLLAKDIAALTEVQITLGFLPAGVDLAAFANAISQKIADEADTFAHTKFKTLTFAITPTTGALRS